MAKIVFNGRAYPSEDAMPVAERDAYRAAMRMFKDEDGDGVPDVLQRAGLDARGLTITTTRIFYNGKEYASADEMPAAARADYERAMARLLGGDSATSVTMGGASERPSVDGAPIVSGPGDQQTMIQREVTTTFTHTVQTPRDGIAGGFVRRVIVAALVTLIVIIGIWLMRGVL